MAEIMTAGVKYCFDDQEVSDVAPNMGDAQNRHLPFVDRNKRLVGIVSLADAARRDPSLAGIGLRSVTSPDGLHNRTQ
nr:MULTISPECIES: CBS domain-containing protein [unclassified Ensifer]